MTPLQQSTRAAMTAIACLMALTANPTLAQSRFTVQADGEEILDTHTHLLWRRCAEGMKFTGHVCVGKAKRYTLAEAKELVQTVAQESGKPWRLPSLDELASLVVQTKIKPMIDADAFPTTPAANFLSSRPGFDDNLNAWTVHFGSGKGYGYTGQAKVLLRLVRPYH